MFILLLLTELGFQMRKVSYIHPLNACLEKEVAHKTWVQTFIGTCDHEQQCPAITFFLFFLKKLNPQYLFLKIQSIKSASCKTYCVHNSFNRTCNCQLQENTWTFWRYHATALTRKQTGWSAGVRILPRRTTWKVCTECGIGVRNTRYMDPLTRFKRKVEFIIIFLILKPLYSCQATYRQTQTEEIS